MIKAMLSDWKFYLFVVNVAGIALLKFNDFRHTANSLKEIKISLQGILSVQIKQGEDIARIQGKLGIK